MRNRFVATVAVAAVAALGLAACGSSDTPGGARCCSQHVPGDDSRGGRWRGGRLHLVGRRLREGRPRRPRELFKEKYPNNTFVNLAVAGGAGSNAKAKLASDLQNNQPPDSFQGHAGAELLDYIDAEQIEPVNDVITALGGDSVFPQEPARPHHRRRQHLLGAVEHPPGQRRVGQHRGAQEGRRSTPSRRTSHAWMADMEKVKAAGVSTPLSVAGTWTQVHLFETVLLADLGVEKYNGLFDGKTAWDSAEVKQAAADYKKLLTYTNTAVRR